MSYLNSAFHAVCKEAKEPEGHFVVLVSEYQAYGGPEEGGWYYTVHNVEAYQQFPTKEQADAAAEKVKTLAKELQADARREHGEQCLREMDWLEARGLEADFLPEPDGPTEYDVLVCDKVPQYNNRRPTYE
jgi:hypothetical protein